MHIGQILIFQKTSFFLNYADDIIALGKWVEFRIIDSKRCLNFPFYKSLYPHTYKKFSENVYVQGTMYESCFANLGGIIIFHLRPVVRLSIENFLSILDRDTTLQSKNQKRGGRYFSTCFQGERRREREKQRHRVGGNICTINCIFSYW